MIVRYLPPQARRTSMTALTPIPRDVLSVLKTELRDARKGMWELRPNGNGIDVDFVEMLEETVAEIERLRAALALKP
jgi:hypothetical protein